MRCRHEWVYSPFILPAYSLERGIRWYERARVCRLCGKEGAIVKRLPRNEYYIVKEKFANKRIENAKTRDKT